MYIILNSVIDKCQLLRIQNNARLAIQFSSSKSDVYVSFNFKLNVSNPTSAKQLIKKLFKSEKAAELLALYRLVSSPEEHRLLNQQYIEQTNEQKGDIIVRPERPNDE